MGWQDILTATTILVCLSSEAVLQTLRQFYEMLDESQWWPAEQLLTWQRQHLRALLNHARSSAPFYRFRLNKVFRPNGDIDWGRWHEIPIITRGDVLKNFGSMLSRAPVPGHGPFQDVQSSGSTGHPVTVRTTRWLVEMGQASGWRAHQWAGLDWAKQLVTTVGPDPRWTIGQNMGPWGPEWIAAARRGRTLYTDYQTTFVDRLRLLKESAASYFSTTSSTAQNIALRARTIGAEVQFEALIARGGEVTEQLRREVRETFGAETVEFYSTKEAGTIAQRCPSGDGYHVNGESVLLEVVDADGRPVAPGETGRAVVTPFGSTALPLIRYDQGDIVVSASACSCGRTLPHLHSISGRRRTEFSHPDGRRRDVELDQACYEMLGASQIQIAQIGPRQFEIRYVAHKWAALRDEEGFVGRFRQLAFEDAEVRLVPMEEIPLSKSGKFLTNVREWTPES